jgi:hypothetical protein
MFPAAQSRTFCADREVCSVCGPSIAPCERVYFAAPICPRTGVSFTNCPFACKLSRCLRAARPRTRAALAGPPMPAFARTARQHLRLCPLIALRRPRVAREGTLWAGALPSSAPGHGRDGKGQPPRAIAITDSSGTSRPGVPLPARTRQPQDRERRSACIAVTTTWRHDLRCDFRASTLAVLRAAGFGTLSAR